jgi:hypothetical protein
MALEGPTKLDHCLVALRVGHAGHSRRSSTRMGRKHDVNGRARDALIAEEPHTNFKQPISQSDREPHLIDAP